MVKQSHNAAVGTTSLARFIGKAGSQGITAVSVVLMAYWLIRRRFRRFWFLFASMTRVELLWLSVVFAIGRPRPVKVQVKEEI